MLSNPAPSRRGTEVGAASAVPPAHGTGSRLLRSKRFYTVLIFPHYQDRFRKLHVSRGFVATLLVVAGALVAAGMGSTHLFLRMQTQDMRVEWLQHENATLRHQNEAFETQLADVASKVDVVEARTSRMARVLDVKGGVPSDRPAAGGALAVSGPSLHRYWFDDEMRSILSRTDTVLLSLDRVEDAWQERERVLSCTPSLMPVEGWLSHNYGWRSDPFTGSREFHRGVDIVAPSGTEILAPADGVVARAGRFAAYGKSIDVSHGLGFVTRYGHLSDIQVRPGQRVQRGDVIGRVGSTGRSTGPHLHYEVFRDGRQVNPSKYLGQGVSLLTSHA